MQFDAYLNKEGSKLIWDKEWEFGGMSFRSSNPADSNQYRQLY